MSWSYDENLTTDRDNVRFLIGDTDCDNPLLSDQEINALVTAAGSVNAAAVAALRHLAAVYRRRPDRIVGDLRITYGELAQAFTDRADELESDSINASPWTALASKTEHDLAAASTDRIVPDFFTPGLHDNPRAP